MFRDVSARQSEPVPQQHYESAVGAPVGRNDGAQPTPIARRFGSGLGAGGCWRHSGRAGDRVNPALRGVWINNKAKNCSRGLPARIGVYFFPGGGILSAVGLSNEARI